LLRVTEVRATLWFVDGKKDTDIRKYATKIIKWWEDSDFHHAANHYQFIRGHIGVNSIVMTFVFYHLTWLR